jgi:hypothetical protein
MRKQMKSLRFFLATCFASIIFMVVGWGESGDDVQFVKKTS